MSVGGVSSTDSSYQINQQNGWQQVMNDFSQLGQALQSGSLTGAQQAFATLQQDMQNVGQSQSGQSQSTQQQSALNQLGQALQSGDLAGAQQAFAALKTSHHHHHSGGTQGTSGGSGGSSTIGNDLNTLATALQSGDLAGAQKAFATLQQDMQNTGQTQSAQQTSQTSQQNNDFNTLAKALQSGDLTGAQQAFTSLMQDAQTAAANFFNSSQTNGNIVNTTA
ncbi:MAG: hypothetical protein ABSH41_23910 [Syntrophobacteraceae bacterium]